MLQWVFTNWAGRINVVGSTTIGVVVAYVERELMEDPAKLGMAKSVDKRI